MPANAGAVRSLFAGKPAPTDSRSHGSGDLGILPHRLQPRIHPTPRHQLGMALVIGGRELALRAAVGMGAVALGLVAGMLWIGVDGAAG